MDALTLLKEDHDKVRTLLSELEETTERAVKTRQEGLARLKSDLVIHEQIEEQILYPKLKAHSESRAIALEAYEEHDVVDTILREIEQTPVEDETWAAKFKVMKENLEHHIEEEEGEMFDATRELFESAELEELGEQMTALKEQLQARSPAA
jgi:porphobilinogen deaminase